MPLGTDPSFSQVRAFFNGSANFKDYYRGGPHVPNIPANAAISATAEGLRLKQFSGADNVSSGTVAISSRNVTDETYNAQSFAAVTLGNNGVFSWNTASYGSGVYSGQWLSGGSAADFEALITTTGGTAGTGTTGSWVNLGTSQTYTRNRGIAGTINWTFTIQIRRVGTTTVLGSATISLSATRTNTAGGIIP